ncbi:LacI family transcriptional regulator [Bacillus shivajii]|uniref:LacI family DNA-binding transcriptional regulator n=1 Tax=Bacillus shivajii TaxID=1983719 RepID=UPI001CFA2AD5|nr:LacI family DNA-binding transcriptional regulator [Bacillus shivajii]UCZ52837.1 LacI family transcriptional regulator [Bacillus shivajii]
MANKEAELMIMKRVTIKDVAKAASTSERTVSRVINNDENVKKETRERVKQVIDELGFEVNMAARMLKEKKTKQIVVFIDRHEGLYWGSFHNEILQEIHLSARKHGYRMLISSSSATSFEEDENDGFYLLKNGLCDGAIIFDSKPGDERVKYLANNKTPFVIIGKDNERYDSSYVDLDNEYAGYLGASYLHSKGYKKISMLLGNKDFVVNKERIAGFLKYCNENDIISEYNTGISSMESAYEAMKQILENSDHRCIFISGDERAMGIYRAVFEAGLKIPDDVAVLGIDNIKLGEYMCPPITTIDQPKKDFGTTAFQILLDQLNGSKSAKRVIIAPEIVERSSV